MRSFFCHGLRLVVALVALGSAGCASIPGSIEGYPAVDEHLELTTVPFYPQERYQCGPGALAAALAHAGATVSVAELIDRVYLPGRAGSLQAEMLAGTRAAGYVPYRVDGTLEEIARELAAGRPVLVLQNLGVSWYPRWHYALVVGIDRTEKTVILRSGTEPRRVTRAATFLRTWRRSGFWGMVVLTPGDLPARPDKERYFSAAAAMESVGQHRAAHAAWMVARNRWPTDLESAFGLANAELALNNATEAESLYAEILAVQPNNAAVRNNLAYALAQQGRVDAAIQQINTALAGVDPAEDSTLRAELLDSLAELDHRENR